MNRLEGNRILVTGAASGIGQATALRLLEDGATVVGADVATDGLEKTRAMAAEAGAGERLTTLEMNIGDEHSVVDGVRSAVDSLGGLDSVVNAAGILRAVHTEQMELELWNRIIGINLTGTFLVVREALPILLKNSRSAIVNFSSTSASFAHPYMAAYAASKGGVQSFTHAIGTGVCEQGTPRCLRLSRKHQVRNHRCHRRIHSAGRGLEFVHQADADPADHGGIQWCRYGQPGCGRRRHRHVGLRGRRVHHRHRNPHRRRNTRVTTIHV